MLLKNLMEDKKLNFNQPLLSVRRYAPALTSQKSDQRKAECSRPVIPRLPAYRSELKSGPIRNPGAVPFVWEQTPGQPKEEIKSLTQNCDRPPIAPKLPPGRYPEVNQQECRKVPPSISRSKNQAVNVPCASDNKKQAVNVPRESRSNPSHDENDKIFESSKETVEEKDSSDSGDSDGAYVDALDILSRTESFFLNCSTSGLSGLDDLDAKPTGRFAMDLQTRDFMMNRFLPAAKAMASETPQYAPKRQHVVQEQPQKVKNIGAQFKPSLRYGPSFAKRYSHYHDDGDEEEESDDEYDQHESLPAVCGLLPRFCLKSSLCLLNPVPAMSVRTRVPTSSANKVQPRSSSAGSYSETENECRSGRTEPKSIDKIHKVKLDDEKTELTNESYRLESDSTSTYRDSPLSFLEDKEVHCIPEEKIHAGLNGFELQEEGIRTFKEILADQGSPKESDGGALIIEKTLYVDTIGRVESPSLRSFSPDTQDTFGFPTSREEYHEIINNSMDQIHTIDSPLEDSKKLDTTDGQDKLLLNAQKLGEFNISSQFADSNKTCETGTPKAFGENGDFSIDSTTTENIEVTENKAAESLEKQLPAATTLGNSHQNYSEFPVPPPLPKSPSDSWLFRTLPSVPPKNSFLRSYLGAAINPENKGSKVPTSDTKWETIVKTTKMQGRHLHYSEGLLATIPET
ncbi:hypothetical protein Sango_2471200 [Sesamum angolense]|uniref:Uncharacterized protein n=1 Tax=Sesamum angolense TaxID=2727404 RepID=A0AAE1W3D8_9LAMI|nr:hypothetical protein Sango_2471200 [Sesamum angolense]